MEPHIAKCGYRCDSCPAFKPELTDADKKDFSRALEQYYDCKISPDQVKPCTRCQSMTVANDKECPVFPCVKQKGLDNCAYCDDFGCDKLKQRMDIVEEYLQKQKDVSADDFEKYFKPFLCRKTLMNIRQKLGKDK